MGLYDDVASALDHAAGSTDEAIGRAHDAGDDTTESFGHLTGGYIIQGDETGQAETLAEGLFSPGERYTATGGFRTAIDTVFENPEPFTNQPDSVDLLGPSVGDAAGQAADAANPDNWGPTTKLLVAAVVALVVIVAIRPLLMIDANVSEVAA
jgi:hypothetical protein